MKKAKLSDYYTEEEKKELPLNGAQINEPFNRAFDDYIDELEVTRQEFRVLYYFASANNFLSKDEKGSYILGVKLTCI